MIFVTRAVRCSANDVTERFSHFITERIRTIPCAGSEVILLYKLMKDMLALLKKRGYERASLAVQKANYAVRMYEKGGFRTVDENDEEFIMACEL